MVIRAVFFVAFAVAALVGSMPVAAEADTSSQVVDVGVPLADHHQHLLSPAAAALQNSLWPQVSLPEHLETLLRERAQAWNDPKKLASLYTKDATVFTGETPGWVRGRDRVAAYLSMRFASAYSLTPVAYRVNGNSGYVTGYFNRGEKQIGYFALVVEKMRNGRWLISGETPTFPGPRLSQPETARELIAYLDEAGIRRAVVLSDAYYFDSPKFDVTDRRAQVQAENDWTAAQVAQFPDRLVAFCSFNPLTAYALEELDRCNASGRFAGLKLHFGTSGVNLRNPEHVKRVRAVLQAADRARMPIIVHVRADANYGREEAEIMLRAIIPAAPDVPFQIAHLWGGENYSGEALRVYADAVAAGDSRTANLYFDLAEVALAAGSSQETLHSIAAHVRRIGLKRVLYGSDGPVADSMSPKDAWTKTRTLPLTADELRAIARNVAPYLQ